jgi:D-sedoheptulose 7-phosphate isomerase
MPTPLLSRDREGVGMQCRERNQACDTFFSREAHRLATASREMADRFLRGGRLLAFGRGPYATDAQHVSVEFVHPVIVGKRALPALDLSMAFRPWIETLLTPNDIVMGFGPPEGDPEISSALELARSRNAMAFAVPDTGVDHPFIHQEIIEIAYHTLWETVHVFLEHQEMGLDTGDAGFLYPFLGQQKQQTDDALAQAANSILLKVADDATLRLQVANEQSDAIALATHAIWDRTQRGGKLILFGNGGSATDANDWTLDCVCPPPGYRPIPAISLAMEPAIVSALANDVGADVIFLRQLIAHALPGDVVIAISTSGGSRNVIVALEEARKRKLTTVALLGYDGGEAVRRNLVDHPIVVRADYIPRIQEVQASIYHIIRENLEAIARGRL